ncbi:hypothetical protein [Mycolicibacterium fallax]|uniref:Uncharacterized protein n=1 Tax=Mycolicibacterium fallax TaxID=1793 RepID=A0A1X1RD84_MYCFA|nr:hypothetical protein [Mycolicibacterium fallax]ORV03191.1 hypothetical protein AWC04_11210 [Mycolicibacterium fallax]BBY98804.1 hypothetical protein MFAL_22710 [Mycolicibacterium fallax]
MPDSPIDTAEELAARRPAKPAVDMDSMPYTEPHPAPIFDTGPHPEPLTGDTAAGKPATKPAAKDSAEDSAKAAAEDPAKGAAQDAAELPADLAEEPAPVVSAWAFSDEQLQWRTPDPVPEAAEPGAVAPAAPGDVEDDGHTENLNILDLDADSLTADPDNPAPEPSAAGPRHAMPGRRGRHPGPAQPMVVPGAYQSVKLWQFGLLLAGVWLVAAAIGVGAYRWWFLAADKIWPDFAVLCYVVVAAVAALLTSLVEQRRPLIAGLAVALMTAPFASGIGAAALYGMYVFKWLTP